MTDSHNLNWYGIAVEKLAVSAEREFGVELTLAEIKNVRDELYRAVNNAKVRQQAKVKA